MGRRLDFVVEEDASGQRVDRFLAGRLPGESRASIQRLIESGEVQREGKRVKPSARLRPGDRLRVHFPDPVPTELVPEAVPIKVLYEDASLLVIEKPPGMVVHPGAGVRSGTLVHALLGREPRLSSIGGKERPGIVHRLDRETSGLMLVAREDSAHRALAEQFATRQVHKIYQALVWGHPVPSRDRIEEPVGRDPSSRTRMAVRPAGGRSALTEYRVREVIGPFSLLEIRILTGRTHQIRVHLKHRGHPVVGDSRYGGIALTRLRSESVKEALAEFGRLALHAATLEFRHPIGGERLRFHAPLPPDFARLLDRLRSLR
jgi:23S rRNA pseudouridine1911/1915/1917 synthase